MKRFTRLEIKGTDIDDVLTQMGQKIGPRQTIVLMEELPAQDFLYYTIILDNRELMS
jgi:hypothetical protein